MVVTASHTLTLRALKLRLYNELDVHPMNMDCYVKGRLLAGDDLSLQALQVRPTPPAGLLFVLCSLYLTPKR